MHKDTQEALERLERELLAEEQPEITDDDLNLLIDGILFDDEEDTPMEETAIYRSSATQYRAYNADETDLDLEEYSDEVYEEPPTDFKELLFPLIILGLICLVMLGWAVSIL